MTDQMLGTHTLLQCH